MSPGKFKNLQELKAHQAELSGAQARLEPTIISEAKASLIQTASGVFNKPADPLEFIKVDGEVNIPAKLFSYLLPLIITATLFRRSGFLTRLIVGIAARQLGKRIGPQVVNWLFRKIAEQLNRKNKPVIYLPGHVAQQTNILSLGRKSLAEAF